MRVLSVPRFGFSLAMALALSYIGCVFVMVSVPKDVAIRFFNTLMHGVDVAPIIRWEMAWWEMVIGLLQVFILGWLFGSMVAMFYNFGQGPAEATKRES